MTRSLADIQRDFASMLHWARPPGGRAGIYHNNRRANFSKALALTYPVTARIVGEFARAGLVNLVGGCCGSTPDHIRAIAAAVRGVAPRTIPSLPRALRLSGLEPLTVTATN